MMFGLADPNSALAGILRFLGALFPLLNLLVIIYLMRLFREVTRGMADIFTATRAAAEEVGKERLLDYLDGIADDNMALQRAVKELETKRESKQRTYREFLEWRRSNAPAEEARDPVFPRLPRTRSGGT